MDHLSFAAFAEQVFAVAGQMPVDRFIVDLRHNSGGNSAVMQPLLDGLARRPQLTGDGKLFAMIGGRTFSSGLLNALELRETVGAVLVGAPTGGAPNTYGEVLSFSLPNSGYVVTYSTKYFALLETFENTLFPDFPVPITSTDYFSGHDPVLAFVLP
jgi:C-terminal processing protease CtpA/Prc